MSISQEVGRYIPYLRRFSRALTGSRAGGDAYALAALETLVADQNEESGKTRLRPGDNPKIVLYRLLLDIWAAAPINAHTDLNEPGDLDQGATANFPVGWYVVTKAWAKKYPQTMAAFLTALREGQQIADSRRNSVEQAMEKLPVPYTVPPTIAAVMSLETYPLSIAPDIDRSRVQRVAEEMYQFHMLGSSFPVSSMLGGL